MTEFGRQADKPSSIVLNFLKLIDIYSKARRGGGGGRKERKKKRRRRRRGTKKITALT